MDPNSNLYNLDTLKSMIGPDDRFIKDFVELFLTTSSQTLKEINNSFSDKNYEVLGSLAHKLKSSVDLMNIESLKQDVRQIEKIGHGGIQPDELPALITNLNQVMNRVFEQLKKEFQLVS